MHKLFIAHYFSVLLKGRQVKIQIAFAGLVLVLSLVKAQGFMRFVSGREIDFADFVGLLFMLYSLLNLIYVLLGEKQQVTDQDSDKIELLPVEQAIGESLNE